MRMRTTSDGLQDYIRFLAGDIKIPRTQWPGSPVARFIIEHGMPFDAARKPREIAWGESRQCFANAGRLAIDDDRYVYCEGYALSLIPCEHAWVFDKITGTIIDNTWRDNSDALYFGVMFKRDYLAARICANECWGVLHTWWDEYETLRQNTSDVLEQLGQ